MRWRKIPFVAAASGVTLGLLLVGYLGRGTWEVYSLTLDPFEHGHGYAALVGILVASLGWFVVFKFTTTRILSGDVPTLRRERKEARDRARKAEEALTEATRRANELQQRLEALGTLPDELDAQQQRVDAAAADVAERVRAVTAREAAVGKLERQVRKLTAELETATGLAEQRLAKIQDLTGRLERADRALRQAEEADRTLRQEHAQALRDLGRRHAAALEQRQGTIDEQGRKLERQAAELKDAHELLEGEMEQNTQLMQLLESARTLLEALALELLEHGDEIAELVAPAEESGLTLQDAITRLELVAETETDLGPRCEACLQALGYVVGLVQKAIVLQKEVTELRSQNEALRLDLKAKSGQLTRLEQRQGQLGREMDLLRSQARREFQQLLEGLPLTVRLQVDFVQALNNPGELAVQTMADLLFHPDESLTDRDRGQLICLMAARAQGRDEFAAMLLPLLGQATTRGLGVQFHKILAAAAHENLEVFLALGDPQRQAVVRELFEPKIAGVIEEHLLRLIDRGEIEQAAHDLIAIVGMDPAGEGKLYFSGNAFRPAAMALLNLRGSLATAEKPGETPAAKFLAAFWQGVCSSADEKRDHAIAQAQAALEAALGLLSDGDTAGEEAAYGQYGDAEGTAVDEHKLECQPALLIRELAAKIGDLPGGQEFVASLPDEMFEEVGKRLSQGAIVGLVARRVADGTARCVTPEMVREAWPGLSYEALAGLCFEEDLGVVEAALFGSPATRIAVRWFREEVERRMGRRDGPTTSAEAMQQILSDWDELPDRVPEAIEAAERDVMAVALRAPLQVVRLLEARLGGWVEQGVEDNNVQLAAWLLRLTAKDLLEAGHDRADLYFLLGLTKLRFPPKAQGRGRERRTPHPALRYIHCAALRERAEGPKNVGAISALHGLVENAQRVNTAWTSTD